MILLFGTSHSLEKLGIFSLKVLRIKTVLEEYNRRENYTIKKNAEFECEFPKNENIGKNK